jgi:hypothetical protein
MCDTISTSGIYVDAAVFALNGSLGDQNWDDTPFRRLRQPQRHRPEPVPWPLRYLGWRRSGTDGYEKKLSFNQRLDFVSPPFIIPGSVPLWVLNNYVECLNATCPALG